MIKVNVSENNESEFLAQTQNPQDCTCYACAGCAFCIIFPPAVGAALTISLAPGLVSIRELS